MNLHWPITRGVIPSLGSTIWQEINSSRSANFNLWPRFLGRFETKRWRRSTPKKPCIARKATIRSPMARLSSKLVSPKSFKLLGYFGRVVVKKEIDSSVPCLHGLGLWVASQGNLPKSARVFQKWSVVCCVQQLSSLDVTATKSAWN